jgi:AraC family transcriptional regulator
MIENKIVTEAIEYILLNIGDNITLEKVADHCHMSVSYFSKIFKEQTGQSVYAFIKRIKMEQSAMRLKMESDRDITDIGADYGYSSSNYSSAFSQYHKKSPSVFRNNVQIRQEEVQMIIDAINAKIRIEIRPDYLVIYERSIGNYKEMKEAWCWFTDKYQDDIDEDTIFFERTFDDPTITNTDRCIYDICMTTKTPEKYKNRCILEGGKFVVYTYKGYLDNIFPLNQQLVSIWFPASHYQIDDRYSYDRYYKVEEDGYMEFDICIPVK